MAAFSLRTFGQVLEDVRQARAWYSDLGIRTAGTRLETIEDRTTALVTDLGTLPPEEVVRRWDSTETYFVLTDGVGFGKIAREIGKVGPSLLPRRKIRALLDGPLVPTDETPGDGSVNPRNLFTELELAATLSDKGIVPTGFDDLQFTFHANDFSVEAKRLHSRRRVQDNVGEAYRQLQKRLRTDRARGLIALGLDKVMDLEQKILRVEPPDTPDREVISLVEDFISRFGRSWQSFVDTRVIAIILIVRFFCYNVARNVIGPAYYLVVIPLVNSGALQGADQNLLLSLASQLSDKTSTRAPHLADPAADPRLE